VNLQEIDQWPRQDVEMNLEDCRVLVTGGTSGVGRELVRQLAKKGAHVVTCGRDETRCQQVRSDHPKVVVENIDLAIAGNGHRLVETAVTAMGGLDVLINNAGIQIAEDYSAGYTDQLMANVVNQLAINVSSSVETALSALSSLAESQTPRIILVSSGLGIFPKKTAPTYCASKSAIQSFARSLRYQVEEFAPQIKVIDVVLPLVDTPMTAGRGKPSDKVSPEVVAKRIIDSIESPRPIVYVGKARLLPLFVRIAPSIGARILRNG